MTFDLRAIEILEHAVDGAAEEGQLILARHRQASGEVAAGSDVRNAFAHVGHARKHGSLEQVERHRAESEPRSEKKQQELQQSGLALLVDDPLNPDPKDDCGLAVDVPDFSVGSDEIHPQWFDPRRIGVGEFVGSLAKIVGQRRGIETRYVHGQVRHFREAQNFVRIQGASHDHGSDDRSLGVRRYHRTGIHQHRTRREHQDSGVFVGYVLMVEKKGSRLQVIEKIRRNGHFVERDEIISARKDDAAGVVQNHHEIQFELPHRDRRKVGCAVVRIPAFEEQVRLIPRGIVDLAAVERCKFVRQRARDLVHVAASEVRLQIRIPAQKQNASEGVESAHESEHRDEDDEKRLAPKGMGQTEMGADEGQRGFASDIQYIRKLFWVKFVRCLSRTRSVGGSRGEPTSKQAKKHWRSGRGRVILNT